MRYFKNWTRIEACPFCGETDFDATGLKIHLLAGHCDKFNAVSVDIPRTREVKTTSRVATRDLRSFEDENSGGGWK